MIKNLRRGQRVMVFKDPGTELRPEEEVKLIRLISVDDPRTRPRFQIWWVRFSDGDETQRAIKIQD